MIKKYRVIKKDNQYGFHVVFFDEHNNILKIENEPLFSGEGLLGLLRKWGKIQEAWDESVIDFHTYEEDYSHNPLNGTNWEKAVTRISETSFNGKKNT